MMSANKKNKDNSPLKKQRKSIRPPSNERKAFERVSQDHGNQSFEFVKTMNSSLHGSFKSQLDIDIPSSHDSNKWPQEKPKELKFLYDKFIEQRGVVSKQVKVKRVAKPKFFKQKQNKRKNQ